MRAAVTTQTRRRPRALQLCSPEPTGSSCRDGGTRGGGLWSWEPGRPLQQALCGGRRGRDGVPAAGSEPGGPRLLR